MAKSPERRKGWQGYLINDLHLPWPRDVTDEQKEQWRLDFESRFKVSFPAPRPDLTPFPFVKRTRMSDISPPVFEGAAFDRAAILHMRDDICETVCNRVKNELNLMTADGTKRLQGKYYSDGVQVTVEIGGHSFTFPLSR